ncbi:hypothetical protein V0R48_20485 [Pseudomonas alcaligenes]|uniref:hypothetical protein n=1 Tax=Aquipseudomonas alcaligenes TaxID=43263 RepID=UPI002E7B0D20|nr:hypothetical protein [Pseudomonas alcaligenes]MEE1951356.1 hypothetical protein [Pseudomonas alcaligenes]
MRLNPEIQEVTLVLVGNFSPAAMTPAWMSHYELISEQEATGAEVTVVHPEATQYKLDWAEIYIDQNRVQIKTAQAPWVRISDFAVRLLRDVLPSTPVKAFGINRSAHYPTSPAQQNHIGEKLAPREFWGEWGKSLHNEKKQLSGLVSIRMRQGEGFDDREEGSLDLIVQASSALKPGAIAITANDHFEVGEHHSALPAAELIERVFENSIRRSDSIMSTVISGNLPS